MSATDTVNIDLTEPIHMGPEPWGRMFLRAREDVAKLSLDQAVALAAEYVLTSTATISRLESLAEVPTGARARHRRQVAYVLCRAYRVDPAEFDLDPDDCPPGLTIRPRTPADLGDSPTNWYTDHAWQRAA